MEKVRWRGTWGIGDSMQALNVCHNYCFKNNTKVNLEMHWTHDEDYLHHPDDPETIIERTNWIHTKYYRQEDVTLTHVFNSDLFESGNMNPNKKKARFYFDSEAFDPNSAPNNDWIFKPEYYGGSRRKQVFWTPTYNSEPPRWWKRVLTSDDWYDIIKLLAGNGWIQVELNYRTPIEQAFNQIKQCNFVVCYDGMWHYIARNLGKPMFIPSKEGITKYNTPNAVTRPKKRTGSVKLETREFFNDDFFNKGLIEMRKTAKSYISRLRKQIEK